jgi:hypothetical protein
VEAVEASEDAGDCRRHAAGFQALPGHREGGMATKAPAEEQETVGAMLLVSKPCLVPVKAAWPCTQETVGTMLPPRLCSVVIVVI